MRRTISYSEVLFLIAVFLIYLWTLAPFLFWRDAPEFVDAVATLGIAHPAGFPTYSLMARWIWMLPLGNIPFRINLFSAVCAVLALGIFVRTSRWILEASGAKEKEATLIPLAAAGIIAVGYPFWGSALSAEVYTLHLLFIAIILHLAIRWALSGDDRLIYLCSLFYGLSSGNHATVALLLPGLLIFFCAKNREATFRKLLMLGAFFLIGFSVYLYLPIRSTTLPNMDWGEPRNLWQMFAHMTDRKDAETHADFLTGGDWGWGAALKMQGYKILQEITPAGAALALLGTAWNLRRFPLIMILMCFALLPHGIFFIHWSSGNIHLQLFLVMGFWMAMGMRQLMEWTEIRKFRSIRPRNILSPLVAGIVAMQIMLNYPRVNLSDDRRVEYSFRESFEAMEPDALCIATIFWFHFRTYQDVMRLREDIAVLGSSFFLAPEHFTRVTPRRFPGVLIPDGDYLQGKSGVDFLNRLVAMNLDQRRPVYLEIYHALNSAFFRHILPYRGFLFRFSQEPIKGLEPDIIHRYILSIRDRMLWEVETGGLMREKEVFHYYIWFFLSIVDYLTHHHDWGNALRLLEFVERFFGTQGMNALWPNERNALDSNMAAVYINTGQYERAKHILEYLASRCRNCYQDYRNLAWLCYQEGRFGEAEFWMQKGLKEKPISSQSLELLGDIEVSLGRLSAALEAYRHALNKTSGNDHNRKKILEQKIERLLSPEILK